ncbi:MAG: hypothetical protein QOD99_1626 [Chthoniobacter sp.]|nr:hypothetical protein [Chthoniobacter sp.]
MFSTSGLAAQVIQTIEQTELSETPFAHLHLRTAFPPEVYERILSCLPETRFYGELQHDDARLPNGRSARRKLELRPAQLRRLPAEQRAFWTQIGAALTSPLLTNAFKNRFAPVLENRFGRSARAIAFHPAAMLLRDLGGYKISIHCDSFRKAVTTQYYLPAATTQTHIGTAFHTRDAIGNFTQVKRLEFAPNTGYAFPVTAESWHSVEQMTSADGERNSLMVIYYIDQGPFGEMVNRLKRVAQDVRARLPATRMM